MTRGETRRALGTVRGGLRELFAVRWIRWAVVLFVLALTVRIGLEQLLSVAVNRIAAERGLVCTWRDLDLSLYLGRGEIHYLEIRPLPTAEDATPAPLLDLQYAVFDLDVLALLRGDLSIARAEVDGLDAWLVREANGDWNVGRHFGADEILALLQDDPRAEPRDEEEEPEPLDLSLPVALQALRFQHATCRFVDRAFDPPLELAFQLNAALSHLNDPDRPTRFSATLLGGDLLNGAHVQGEAAWGSDVLQVTLRAEAGGIHTRVLEPYLEDLDIRPASESIAARLLADVRIEVVGEARDTLRAHVELSEVHLKTDGIEALALDRLRIDLDSFSPRGAVLPGIEVEGIRGFASLEPDSALRIAGLDLTGMRWAESISELMEAFSTEGEDSSGLPAWLSLLFEKDADAYSWSLGSLDVRAGMIDFTDRTVEPASSFPLFVDSVHIGEVAHVPGSAARTIPVSASLRAPGLAETIAVKGALGPFAPQRSIDLELQVDGIGLASLAPHLQRIGVEQTLQRGSFHARLVGEAETDTTGRTEGRLALEQIALADVENLFGIQTISATELLFDPLEGLLRLGDIEISGTQLSLGRDPSQHFFALGLRTLGFTPGGEAPPEAPGVEDERAAVGVSRPGQPPPERARPRIELGRLAWIDSNVEFVDYLTDPPNRLTLDELTFELTNLTLGGDPAGAAYEPARFTARVAAPGILDELTLDGRIHSRPGPVDLLVELTLQGHGGTGVVVGPYLRALGIEPTYDSATLALNLEASLKQEGSGWLAGLSLRDVELRDGDAALLSCEELRIGGVRIDEGGVAAGVVVGELALTAPHATARRDDNGQLVLAGMRLVARETGAPVAEAPPPTLTLPVFPMISVQRAAVADARIAWSDATFTPELVTELVVDASAGGLNTAATPGTFEARLHVPGTLERLGVQGTLTIGSAELSLSAVVDGEGVRPGPLARLLPAGMRLESSAGRLRGAFEALLRPAEEGGLAADLRAQDCSWGEEGAEPWVALTSARLAVPRLDLMEGVLVIGPITAKGVTVEAERDADGTLHLLGLALGLADSNPAKIEEQAAETETEAPAATLVPPHIELVADVTLELERLRFRDASLGPEALPLEARTTFRLETPLVAVAADPAGLDPIRWQVEGSLKGLVEHWSLTGQLTPFATEPKFEVVFEAAGVRTAGVIERAPELAGFMQGEVEEGTLAAAMKGTLFVRRARPTELGLSRPFSAEVLIEGVEYRDRPDGTILAGVDRITVDIERVDAGQGLVHMDTIEVLRPRGVLRRKDMVVHALGFALSLDADAQDATDPEPFDEPRLVEASARVEPEPPTTELRIDEIIVSGLAFEILDETADPALRIPLTELDAELKHFTTRALTEKRALHFSGYLQSGADDQAVFEEMALAGRVSLYPEPAGWAQLSMTGLELPQLAPLAATEGLSIEDGALDASVRLRLKGYEGARVDASLVFTDLDLEEPEGGLIERTLSLPMALDSVLFLLRNADGEHRFSTGFSVDEDGIGGGRMAAAASRALAEVLARALAAVPFRLLGALIPGGDEEDDEVREIWSLGFAPGATEPGSEVGVDLRSAATLLEAHRNYVLVLQHELTAEDVARAELLANPSAETCLELVQGLRQRKAELIHLHDRVVTEAYAMYAIGDERAAEASDILRGHERELASIEAAQDRLLEIVRSDSPRQRLKRTRSTAREIADLRLEAIHAELRRRLRGTARERIEIRSPRFEVVPGEGGGRVLLELRGR